VFVVRAIVALALLIASCLVAMSDEPLLGARHSFHGSAHDWQLHDTGELALTVFRDQSQTPIASYDLTGCLFCAGEEDNCEHDGVAEIKLGAESTEPILAVTCHVGAHSQRLDILAPWRNDKRAIFTIYGAYYVTHTISPGGIAFESDVRAGDGTFEQRHGRWP